MKTNFNLFTNFANDLNINNLNILDFISESDLDENTTFDTLTEILEDNDAFNVEIILYSNAIKYLMENDPSLQESLEIASEYGYNTKDLNSEILASLLASQNLRDEWNDNESEITDFLDSLEWIED